jgi:hypothetical protein
MTAIPLGPTPARRDALARRICLLVAATITHNAIEAVVALTAGTLALLRPERRLPVRVSSDSCPSLGIRCAYTSMCEPMMTVRSRGRLKYSAASAVM